ncbi:MAG: glucosyltransferase domain-containing protein [Bacteroidales bacterium]|nr:glucosyltransferase domain-containing protein [Bacteroidales bacterium]
MKKNFLNNHVIRSQLVFFSIIFLLSIPLLFFEIQKEIITFGEIFIVRRSLNHPVWHHILTNLSSACLVFSGIVIMVFLAFSKDTRMKVYLYLNKDLISVLKRLWNTIPPVYKRSFFVIFIGLNTVFLLHTTSFMWGNHDTSYLSYKIPLFPWQISTGRYFIGVIPFFLTGGHFLPVIVNIINFTLFSFTALMLCYYWKLPHSALLYSITGLLFVLQPYILPWLYFIFSNPFQMTYGFFVIIGLILGEKASLRNSNLKRVGIIFIASFLFWFALGLYQVLISTIAVVFAGRILIDIIYTDNKGFIGIIKKHLLTMLSILISLSIYCFVFFLLKRRGIIIDYYNNQLLPFDHLFFRLKEIVKTAQTYLIIYKQSFFPKYFSFLFTILLLFSLFSIGIRIFLLKVPLRLRFIKFILFFIFIFAVFFLSFLPNIISQQAVYFNSRIDFYGSAYFNILIIVILFKQNNNFIKNIALIICIILIYICAISDFYAMKVWKLSFEAEKMEWNRIITRIETTPEYQDKKDYNVVILGATEAYYKNFYQGEYNNFELLRPYMAGWDQMSIFHTYTAHSRNGVWRQISDYQPFSAEFTTIISTMPDEVENAEAWPSLKSIFIKDDIMFIALNQGVLDKVKELAKEYNYTWLNEDDFKLLETIPISEDTALISVNDIESWENMDDNLVFHCGTYDPYIVIPLSDFLSIPAEEACIVIECTNSNAGGIQVFYDYGSGFTEENSTGRIPLKGIMGESSNIILPIVGQSNESKLKAVRIDPPNGATFTLHGLRIVTTE